MLNELWSFLHKYFFSNLWSKAFDFNWRASRSEYWYYNLIFIILLLIFSLVLETLEKILLGWAKPIIWSISWGNLPSWIEWIIQLIFFIFWIFLAWVMFIPWISLGVRRLHDVWKSWTNLFWNLIPYIWRIYVLILTLRKSDWENKYSNSIKIKDNHTN